MAYIHVPSIQARPRRLAALTIHAFDESDATVTLEGAGAKACRAAFAVCNLLRPIRAWDHSGTTRPWHPVVKKTDRGPLTSSTDHTAFELELHRLPRNFTLPFGAATGVVEDGEGRIYYWGPVESPGLVYATVMG
jgi:hypothetical protein